MKSHYPMTVKRRPVRQAGFNLAELMIASAIGLIIVAALSYVLVTSMQSRTELEKSSRQIESGRYAMDELRKDIQLAGFYSDYVPPTTTVWTTPDPCSTTLQDMGFAAPNYSWNTTTDIKVPVGLQGYTDTETAPSCVTNRKAGTDIVVVRRTSTTAINIDVDGNGAADANVDTDGNGTTDKTYASLGAGYYLQASNCPDTAVESSFIMDHDTSKFTSHKVKPVGTPPSCLNGGLSELRRYTTLIYYISTCNNCSGAGDGIPTLKVVELTPATSVCAADAATACGTMTSRTVAEGIENMQIEYGIDSPLQDGTPDTYSVDPVAAADWKKVVAAKIFLLARNTETTPGYINDRIYSLKSGVPDPGGTPFNDNYKRHVYSSTTMATNIAGRRLP